MPLRDTLLLRESRDIGTGLWLLLHLGGCGQLALLDGVPLHWRARLAWWSSLLVAYAVLPSAVLSTARSVLRSHVAVASSLIYFVAGAAARALAVSSLDTQSKAEIVWSSCGAACLFAAERRLVCRLLGDLWASGAAAICCGAALAQVVVPAGLCAAARWASRAAGALAAPLPRAAATLSAWADQGWARRAAAAVAENPCLDPGQLTRLLCLPAVAAGASYVIAQDTPQPAPGAGEDSGRLSRLHQPERRDSVTDGWAARGGQASPLSQRSGASSRRSRRHRTQSMNSSLFGEVRQRHRDRGGAEASAGSASAAAAASPPAASSAPPAKSGKGADAAAGAAGAPPAAPAKQFQLQLQPLSLPVPLADPPRHPHQSKLQLSSPKISQVGSSILGASQSLTASGATGSVVIPRPASFRASAEPSQQQAQQLVAFEGIKSPPAPVAVLPHADTNRSEDHGSLYSGNTVPARLPNSAEFPLKRLMEDSTRDCSLRRDTGLTQFSDTTPSVVQSPTLSRPALRLAAFESSVRSDASGGAPLQWAPPAERGGSDPPAAAAASAPGPPSASAVQQSTEPEAAGGCKHSPA
eukprot:TRINITY_DN27488_c0_g1_i1.p1 TRINITY_DN27488_c0_g1~~TRINITY_DN27488_c0_g1_i1.p1  ORF type:complete len:604 (+),score=143.49 TRINITY_DN27488_c0_g1_i1:65-1813(+)